MSRHAIPPEPVRYVEGFPEHLPGQRHFVCDRLSATLSPTECGVRHGVALGDTRGRHSACRDCPIGRVHAAGLSATREALQAAIRGPGGPRALCVRCGRQSGRLIGQALCVSCYNREREAKEGRRNSKGKVPVTYAPLRLRRVGLEMPDGEIRWALFEAQTWLEPLLRGLAAYPGARLHAGQPGDDAPWHEMNETILHAEYRDAEGRPLAMDVEATGNHYAVRYRPALPGDLPAPVVAPVSLYDPGFVADWLHHGEEGQTIGEAWRAVGFGCDACRQGVMQARRRAGVLEVRCTGCGVAEGSDTPPEGPRAALTP